METPTIPYADPETNRVRLPVEPAAKKSLTAGLCFFVTPLPSLLAILWGVLAVDRISRSGGRGKWQAWTGIALGLSGTAVWIAAILYVRAEQANVLDLKVASELRDLGQALLLYANDHKGILPGTLEDMAAQSPNDAETREAITCEASGEPLAPNETYAEFIAKLNTGKYASFVYLGGNWTPDVKCFGTTIRGDVPFAYVAYPNHRTAMLGILFSDGHVELHTRSRATPIIQKRILENSIRTPHVR